MYIWGHLPSGKNAPVGGSMTRGKGHKGLGHEAGVDHGTPTNTRCWVDLI